MLKSTAPGCDCLTKTKKIKRIINLRIVKRRGHGGRWMNSSPQKYSLGEINV